MTNSFEKAYKTNEQRFIREWSDLLRFPSISAEPANHSDCERCAAWLTAHLESIGFSAELRKTETKPLVIASREGNPDRPSLLVYGHYDVQPVDPLADWTTPPFDPQIRNGRLYARGAEDNKGQFFYVIKALETLIAQGQLKCNVKVLLEGEEEFGGSHALSRFLSNHSEELKSDILMVTDVGRVPSMQPTIIMGLRGIIAMSVRLTGANYDLHSGMHGGLAPNPATAMARLIASLHNPDGSIAVQGFDRGIRPVSEVEKKLAGTTPFDPDLYFSQVGVAPVAGEQAFSPVERLGFRPTVEINGFHSGYGGPGGKTIIPAEAEAKISARLVADQTPDEAIKAIKSHLETNAPAGLKLEITDELHGGPPLRVNPDTRAVKLAVNALKKVTGQEPVYYYEGASIPIIAGLSAATGADPVLVGFGCQEDRAHAPDESFSLDQFRMGFQYSCELISSI